MQSKLSARPIALPAVVMLGLALFGASLMWGVPAAAAASGPLDAQSTEIVRLINGARAAQGKAALMVDPFLASKARDGAIPCPDDATKTIAGRTEDFATYGTMSHSLRLCNATAYTLSTTSYVSVMQNKWSYWSVGEINLVNGGYGSGAFLYTIGSWQTWTYATTGHAMLGWATSSSHWNIIMGSYDRVGCGGWAGGSAYYYECSFSMGGSSPDGLRSPPTVSPFDNALPTATDAPVATPTPVPTAIPTSAPTAAGTAATTPGSGGGKGGGTGGRNGSSGGSGSSGSSASSGAQPSLSDAAAPFDAASTQSPGASPTSIVAGEQAAAATGGPQNVMAGVLSIGGNDSVANDGATGLPATVAKLIALVAGSSSAVLALRYAFLSIRRRRRRETAR